MKAIYKKEFKGLMTSMIGYVFIAFLLVITGIYFTAYQLQSAYPEFSYTLQTIVFVFLIGTPILTMRVLAEEKRQKTDQLLLTSPVSVTGIVTGKYLALLNVFAVPVCIMAFYPLIMAQFGSVAFAETYTALFGFFLLGACYLAIGLFLSSVTESQVIAAVLTFLFLFAAYVIQGISSFFPETASASFYTLAVAAAALAYGIYNVLGKKTAAIAVGLVLEGGLTAFYVVNASAFEGIIQDLLAVFDLAAPFEELAGGIFDVTAVLYYVSVIFIFLFLTVQVIEKRRWGQDRRRLKNGSYSMAMTGIVLAVCVAVNLIASELPTKYTKPDVSSQQLSVIGAQTEEVAAALTEDVTLYYIVQDDNRDTNVSRLLERYADASSHIKIEEIDPVRSPNFTSQYTDSEVAENSVIAVCGESSRVIDYSDMYEQELDYNYYSYVTTGFDAEGQLTSAVAAVSSDSLPKVYTLTGHGELELSSTFTSDIEKENIELESLNLVTSERVPEDADCILIVSPTTDLSPAETNKLFSYLKTGGKLLMITDYADTEMPNLETILREYGMEKAQGVVMEGDSQNYVQIPYYLIPEIESTSVTEGLTGGNAYVIMAAAQGLTQTEEIRDGLTVQSVLQTSDSAFSKTDIQNMTTYEKESGDVDGPFALGMTATEEVELTDELLQEAEALLTEETLSEDTALAVQETEGTAEETVPEDETSEKASEEMSEEVSEEVSEAESEETSETAAETEAASESEETAKTAETRVAVYTSSSLVDDSMNQMVSGGNSRLFLNTLSWMCGHETTISIPVKSMSMEYLTITAASANFWSIVVIVILPLAFILYGLFVWIRRRKQ